MQANVAVAKHVAAKLAKARPTCIMKAGKLRAANQAELGNPTIAGAYS